MTESSHEHRHSFRSCNDLVVATRPLLDVHVQRMRRHLQVREEQYDHVIANKAAILTAGTVRVQ